MSALLTVAYVVGFFLLTVATVLYLTWYGLEGDHHSPPASR
jgi:hypothetical protein